MSVIYTLFARPEWTGLPATASWPTVWPNQTIAAVGAVVLCVGFNILAVYS